MTLHELVSINEKAIASFNDFLAHNEKNYQVISSLNTLDNTNEAQEEFIVTKDKAYSIGEKILRLYGLLQSLFVSIDSLYSLSYGLTNSKSYINLNQNAYLRELKYIRNDVVGHPSNRVVENDEVAYCVLKKEDISELSFSYYTFLNDNVEKKNIDLTFLLENYYLEANSLLKNLYNVVSSIKVEDSLSVNASNLFRAFSNNDDYHELLEGIVAEYKKREFVSKNNHRVLWRYDLITKLEEFVPQNNEERELANYAIGFNICKIVEIINPQSINLQIKRKMPKLLSSFFKFLHLHTELESLITYMYDMSHPLFLSTVNRVKKTAKTYSAFFVIDYMELLERLFKEKSADLVYAFGILAKKYSKK